MTNFTHDVAAFVLPVSASFAAIAAAFVAFTVRREAAAAVAVVRPQSADLMGTTPWFGGSVEAHHRRHVVRPAVSRILWVSNHPPGTSRPRIPTPGTAAFVFVQVRSPGGTHQHDLTCTNSRPAETPRNVKEVTAR